MEQSEIIELLGYRATDKVSGFSGVISSITFDLYGCTQALILPPAVNHEFKDSHWLDLNRLEVHYEHGKVMESPHSKALEDLSSINKGPADKPMRGFRS